MTTLSTLTVRLSVLTLVSLLTAFSANVVGDLAIDFDFDFVDVRFSDAEVIAELTARL